jgi:hypothetical protein
MILTCGCSGDGRAAGCRLAGGTPFSAIAVCQGWLLCSAGTLQGTCAPVWAASDCCCCCCCCCEAWVESVGWAASWVTGAGASDCTDGALDDGSPVAGDTAGTGAGVGATGETCGAIKSVSVSASSSSRAAANGTRVAARLPAGAGAATLGDKGCDASDAVARRVAGAAAAAAAVLATYGSDAEGGTGAGAVGDGESASALVSASCSVRLTQHWWPNKLKATGNKRTRGLKQSPL